MINHGTQGGYHAHRRTGSEPCQPCKDAVNTYMRKYRKDNPDRDRVRDRVRRKAMAALRDMHRADYDELVKRFEQEERLL